MTIEHIPAPPSPEALAAGFDLARRMRNPAFRQLLKDLGYVGDGTSRVMVARPTDSIAEVLGRLDDGNGRHLLAVVDPDAEHGFRFAWLGANGGR